MENQKELTIRVEIPYVQRRCLYDKAAVLQAPNRDEANRYMTALHKEELAAQGEYSDYKVSSVVLGPGAIQAFRIQDYFEIVAKIQRGFCLEKNAPIVVQCEPWDLDPSLCAMANHLGRILVNLRLFSCDRNMNERIGRGYPHHGIKWAADELHYRNVNFVGADLILEDSKMAEQCVLSSIDECIEANVVHITLRNIGKQKEEQYQRAKEKLVTAGYACYAGSCFAKDGWKISALDERMNDCLGFGVGAISRIDGYEIRNTNDIHRYIEFSDHPEMCIER